MTATSTLSSPFLGIAGISPSETLLSEGSDSSGETEQVSPPIGQPLPSLEMFLGVSACANIGIRRSEVAIHKGLRKLG